MKNKTIISCLVGIVGLGITILFYSNFSLYTKYVFNSEVYKIENNYIYNISTYTSVSLYEKYFDVEGYNLEIKNFGEYISNGSELILLDKNNSQVSRFVNIIKGDIVSDGVVDNKDIYRFREYLSNSYDIKDYEEKCFDINDDGSIDNNDLKLLEDAYYNGIKDIVIEDEEIVLQIGEEYRIRGSVLPNYGVNINLVYVSDNNDIVSVDDAGKVVAKSLGITSVLVYDYSSKIKKEVNIIVDNNIKLSSNSGDIFVSEIDTIVDIKAISYDGIECVSSDLEVASCRVDRDKLYIKANKRGKALIKVISKNYGEASYDVSSYISYLDFIPDYYCLQSKNKEIINLGYNYDNLSIYNNKLINNVYIEGNLLYLDGVGRAGREELILKNDEIEKKFIVDIVNLSIPSIGSFVSVGSVGSADIVFNNTNKLSCITLDSSIAECYIDNNKLYFRGLKKGQTVVEIINTSNYLGEDYECGKTQFLVVVR